MNILLTNDDGYNSCGLTLLAYQLSSAGHNVYVVAPDGQRSAFSHSINLRKELGIKPLESYSGAVKAYTCSGSPADCVKFAALNLNVKFDLLISGPNNGENYGFAVVYSGTVAAAEEGVLQGIPSIALSRLGWSADGGSFHSAVEYLVKNLNLLMDYCDDFTLLNVNVPNLPTAQIKGLKVCDLCLERYFADKFVETDKNVWKIVGERKSVNDGDSDLYYSENGYVTVTPLTLLRSDKTKISKMKGLER